MDAIKNNHLELVGIYIKFKSKQVNINYLETDNDGVTISNLIYNTKDNKLIENFLKASNTNSNKNLDNKQKKLNFKIKNSPTIINN